MSAVYGILKLQSNTTPNKGHKMTTVTANFGTRIESVDVPDAYIDDVIDDYFANGAITVTTNSDALV